MSIERRFTAACELRNAEDDPQKITGYAAVYHRADDDGTEYSLGADIVEHIMPGAFDDAIGRDDVRALFNHDPDHVLGRNRAGTLRLTADARGLRYEVDMPDTQLARDLRESINRGDISGSSFAFTIPEGGQEWREDGDRVIREIRAVELHDVGPVTYPAYESSTTHARACYTKWREGRAVEDAPAPAAEPAPEPQPVPGIPADVIIATARLREIDAAE